MSFEDLRAERLKKLELIRETGVEAYPIESAEGAEIATVVKNWSDLLDADEEITLVGRLLARRGHGGAFFADLNDGSLDEGESIAEVPEDEKGRHGTLQLMLKKDLVGEAAFNLFENAVDVGDFLECRGSLFVTTRGEKTLQVSAWRMLAKSLRPLPDKWHGLQDIDERFRRRYLDSLMNPEVKSRFILRSRLISAVRQFLDDAGYLEVDTPVLQAVYGGASAQPFKTHHNALALDLFLRIAPELYLKKMLIGGFPKVYEVVRNFRNEGIDVTHNPEFTNVEFYAAYSDAPKQRAFVQALIKHVVKKVLHVDVITYNAEDLSIDGEFAVLPYFELFSTYAQIESPQDLTPGEWMSKAKEFKVECAPKDSRDKIMDNIYKKVIRPKLIAPTFIVDYPATYLPLAKRFADRPDLVDAFQLVIAGVELVKGFSELNDPLDQAARFSEQDKIIAAGDTEGQPSDAEFVEALEYGMPPAGGVGIGLDRLAMLLTNVTNIKEVIYFPTMKPRGGERLDSGGKS